MAGNRSSGLRPRVLGVTPHPGTELPRTTTQIASDLGEITPNDRIGALNDALAATPADMRRLINRQRDKIEGYADTLYVMNIGDTTAKVEQFYSWNIIRITSIFVMTPTASTAVTLTFGGKVLGLPSGYVAFSPCSFVHKPDEPITLTVTPALTATAWLWLQGEQLPEVTF